MYGFPLTEGSCKKSPNRIIDRPANGIGVGDIKISKTDLLKPLIFCQL